MNLSEKLRSAAKSPDNWDVPGLLEDAANFVDATLATCESVGRGLELLKSQQPLSRDEMVAEVASRR